MAGPPPLPGFFAGFAGLWLAITSLLWVFSGWASLQQCWPDRDELPTERLRWQSGQLGGGSLYNPWGNVAFNNCLRLDVCPSGLRVGIWRIFGLFSRPFFVPWPDIAVEEARFLCWRMVRLRFGDSGRALTIRRAVFDRIAAHSPLGLPA